MLLHSRQSTFLQVLESNSPGLTPWLSPFLAVCLWANKYTFLSLRFLGLTETSLSYFLILVRFYWNNELKILVQPLEFELKLGVGGRVQGVSVFQTSSIVLHTLTSRTKTLNMQYIRFAAFRSLGMSVISLKVPNFWWSWILSQEGPHPSKPQPVFSSLLICAMGKAGFCILATSRSSCFSIP